MRAVVNVRFHICKHPLANCISPVSEDCQKFSQFQSTREEKGHLLTLPCFDKPEEWEPPALSYYVQKLSWKDKRREIMRSDFWRQEDEEESEKIINDFFEEGNTTILHPNFSKA